MLLVVLIKESIVNTVCGIFCLISTYIIGDILFSAYSVTVGVQQTAYTVGEVDGYQLVCFELVSGDLARRELTFDYSTTSGTAGN